jgi:ABC-type uncharacterized transport system substrate-binding protein
MVGTKLNRSKRTAALAGILALCLPATPSIAHPHVFVTYEATVVYNDAMVTGLQHVWTFDDMYTAMAVQGLDKNGDGIYDREELAELAQVNMDGLKEFDHFTYAKLGDAELKFAEPTEAWLEHSDGILRLHFSLPLEKPVFADAEGLKFAIYDPTYFIAFEPEQTDAIKLASAPQGCTAALVDSDPATEDELKRLGDAFAQQLGTVSDYAGGISAPRTVAVSCRKS